MMGVKIDLTPAVLDLVLYAGDGTSFEIDFIDNSEPPQPIDVSYISWAAQIRKTRTAETAYELEIDTTSAAAGIIFVRISKDITSVLPKSCQWDLQGTPNSSTDPVTILQGSVSCKPDVTRPVVTP